jgi:putative ABC transport system substrate-binding protein
LEGAFAAMARARAQAVLVLGGAFVLAERQRVTQLAIKHRLPMMSNLKDVVEAGGLMSYSPNYNDLYRRGALYVDISRHVGRVNRKSVLVDQLAA